MELYYNMEKVVNGGGMLTQVVGKVVVEVIGDI